MEPSPEAGMAASTTLVGPLADLTVSKFGDRFMNEEIEVWNKRHAVIRQPGMISRDILDVN